MEHVEPLFSDAELPAVLARMERSRSMFIRHEAYTLYARRVHALRRARGSTSQLCCRVVGDAPTRNPMLG